MAGPVAGDVDVITDVLNRVAAVVPDMSVDAYMRIDRESRAVWGGREVYVSVDPQADYRRQAAVTAWRNGVPIHTIHESLGLSRSTIYRLLQQRGTS